MKSPSRTICVLLSAIVQFFAASLPSHAQRHESFTGDNVTDLVVQDFVRQNKSLVGVKFYKCPNISDKSLAAMKDEPLLETLQATQANFTGSGLSELKAMPCLKQLELLDCPIAEENLKYIPRIGVTSVSLYESPVGDTAAWYLSHCPALEYLNLGQTKVTDVGVSYLKKLSPSLKYLYLLETPLTDKCADDLASLPNLELLDLRTAGITHATVQKIARLKKLKTLLLQGPNITDHALLSLKAHPSLQRLDLTGTSATPISIKQLKQANAQLTITEH